MLVNHSDIFPLSEFNFKFHGQAVVAEFQTENKFRIQKRPKNIFILPSRNLDPSNTLKESLIFTRSYTL